MMKTFSKKIWALLLAGVFLFSSIGCGSNGNAQTASADSVSTSDASLERSSMKTVSKEKNAAVNSSTKTSDKKQISYKSIARPSKDDALKVKKGRLVNSKGKAVQLRGISTHGINWYPQYVNQKLFKEFSKKWNADVIRLAMYTAEYNGYTSGGSQKDLKKLVCDGIDYATKADMYVIVDWHILSDNNPNMHKKEAKAFFKYISKKYKKSKNVIYEICNEPNGNTSWDDIKKYANSVIKVIRKNNPDAIIIVGTPTWSQDVDKAAASPLKFKNVMYTLHFYAATHKDDLRNKMVAAVKKKLPIFVTEFGICDASGNGSIDEKSANTWIKTLNKYGISYCMWSLSNKDESASMLLPSCNKTSGLKNSDLRESGKWLFKTLTGKNASVLNTTKYDYGNPDSDSSDTGNSGSNSSDSNTSAVTGEKVITGTSGSIKYTMKPSSSWEQDGKTVVQYDITVTNTSDSDITSWNLSYDFGKKITVVSGWNGIYKVSGTTLAVTNESYNGTIAAGQSTSAGVQIKK